MVSGCLEQVLTELQDEHHASILKYGVWDKYSPVEIHKAVSDEFEEYQDALTLGDIHGPHGQRRELLQLANCCIKGIMRLGHV